MMRLANIGLIVLAFAGLVGCDSASQPMVKERYFNGVSTAKPLEAKYTGLGEFTVASRTFSSGEEKFPSYKIWYPAEMEQKNKAYPLVIMANGTGVTYPRYEPIFEHLASWGFIVAGNDDEWSALGSSSAKELDFILAQSKDPSSLFYRKVDVQKIGIAGHSQGGTGAIHAVTDFPNGSNYRALYSASAVSLSMIESWKIDKRWIYDVSKIRIPYMMVAGTGGIDAKTIAPLASLGKNFDDLTGNAIAVMARRRGVDHGNTLDHADGYMTAWFRFLLLGDMEAKGVFSGVEPEILQNARNWQDVKIKGEQSRP